MTTATSTERECLRAAGLVAVGVAVVGVLVWAASFPGWPLAAGVAVSVLVLGGLLMIMGAEPAPAARWLRPAGLLAALVLAIGGGIVVEVVGDAVLQARFERSRVAFEQAVQDAGPIPDAPADHWQPYPGSCPAQLGTYRIGECHAFDGGLMFLQQRSALGDDAGFAYAPDGPPVDTDGVSNLPSQGFTPLGGGWYAWTCDC